MNGGNPDFSHITTVIFDMDGTLIEHTWQLSTICNVLFERFADPLAPVTQDDFFDCYWDKSTDLWYMMVDGVIDGETAARYGYANTLRALGQDESLAQPMLDAWRALVLEEAVPFDDTYTVLTEAGKKFTTGILTNGFTVLQRLKINKYQLTDYVEVTLVSEEAGFHKPDPRIFEEMLKRMGQPDPGKTLYVGDNLITDISGAQAAGITPIFMNPRNDAAPPDGVIKITQLSHLLPLLGVSGGPEHLQ